MEPTELPSEEDRKELRAEGIYPLSTFLIRVGGLCGVCLGIVLVRGEASSLVSLVRGVWEQGVVPLDRLTHPLEGILSLLFRVIGGIVGCCVIGAGVFGAIQTRGDFRPSRISLELRNLKPFRGFSLANFSIRILFSILIFLLLPLCAWVLVRNELGTVMSFLTMDRAMALGWPGTFLKRIILLAACGALMVGVIVGVFTYIRFLYAHRVVRKDVV